MAIKESPIRKFYDKQAHSQNSNTKSEKPRFLNGAKISAKIFF